MRKLFSTLRALMALLFLCTAGSVWGDTYTITFATGSSDESTEIETSTTVSTVISAGTDYVSGFTSNCSKAYLKCTSGVKLGSSKAAGTFEFSLASAYQTNIKSITVKSAVYSSDTGTLTLSDNNEDLKTGITPGTDYTHTYTSATTVSSIKLATSSKRAYISEIVIETESSGPVDPNITPTNKEVEVGTELDVSTMFSSNSSGAFTYTITKTPENAVYTFSTPTFSATTTGDYTVTATQAAVDGKYKAGEATATITVVAKKTATSLTWSAESFEAVLGNESYTFPTLTKSPEDITGITYESSNTDVATIDSDGKITLLKAGETTITASFTGDATYAASSASYTLKVVKQYTITYHAGSGSYKENEIVNAGESVTLLAATISITGWSFVGWSTKEITETSTRPSSILAGQYTPTADVNLYAVYSKQTDDEKWQKIPVSNVSSDGIYAIISSEGYAFNGTISDNGYGECTSSSFSFDSDGYATSAPEGACKLTFTNTGSGYTMYNVDHGYLYSKAAKVGNLAWHSSELSYWYYGSSNWLYKSNSTYLREVGSGTSSTFRTYAKGDNNVIYFAHLVTSELYNTNPTPDKTVVSVSIKTSPDKLYYKPGDNFDPAGTVLSVIYEDDSNSYEVKTGYTTSLDGTTLSTTNTSVTFTYEGKTTEPITIHVMPLDKIEVTTSPKTEYTEGETLDLSGMVVTATWGTDENKIVETVNGYSTTPKDGETLNEGDKLTVSYTSDGVTKTCELNLTITALPVYKVYFVVNATTITKDCKKGGTVTIPVSTTDFTIPDGWEFMGWAKKSITDITTSAPDYVLEGETEYEPTESVTTFYAVFRKEQTGTDRICGYKLYVDQSGNKYVSTWDVNDFLPSENSADGKVFFFEDGENGGKYIYYYLNPGTSDNPSEAAKTREYLYLNPSITDDKSRMNILEGMKVDNLSDTPTEWTLSFDENNILNISAVVNDTKYYFSFNTGSGTKYFRAYKESNTNTNRSFYQEEACVYFTTYIYSTDTSDRVLDKIGVTTPPQKTKYATGDTFDPTGMVVTAYFNDGTTSIVDLNACTFDPYEDLPATTTEITITYLEKSTTTPVTMNPLYTVTFNTGMGQSLDSWKQTSFGESIELPKAELDQDKIEKGWYFFGWSEKGTVDYTTAKPTCLSAGTSYKPESDVTLTAVYCMLDEPITDIYWNYGDNNFEFGQDYTTKKLTKEDGTTETITYYYPGGSNNYSKSGTTPYAGETYSYIPKYLNLDYSLTGIVEVSAWVTAIGDGSVTYDLKKGQYYSGSSESDTPYGAALVTVSATTAWTWQELYWKGEVNDEEIRITPSDNGAIDNMHVRLYTPYYVSTLNALVLDEAKDADNLGYNDTYDDVTVKRVLKPGKWNTLCLPFVMNAKEIEREFGAEVEVMQLSSIQLKDEGWSLRWKQQETMEAGVVYMVRTCKETTGNSVETIHVYGDVEVNTKTEPESTMVTDADGNSMSLQGNYNYITVPSDQGCFIINNNLFYYVNSKATLKGFRGYLQGKAYNGEPVQSMTFEFDSGEDETVTDIGSLQETRNTKYYDLSGRQVVAPRRGLYISAGRKVILK